MQGKNNEFEIVVSDKIERIFNNYMESYSYEIEAGGILIGRIDYGEKKIMLLDLSEPVEGDKRTRFSYKRSELGHQQFMDEMWEKSGHTVTYLGEWHTHNQNKIMPSPVDYSNWIRLSNMKHNTDILVFIILGRKDFALWTSKGGKIEKVI